MIGDGKFNRVWDDQLSVAVPRAILAPDWIATLRDVGIICPFFMHNMFIDDRLHGKSGGIHGYKYYFAEHARTLFFQR